MRINRKKLAVLLIDKDMKVAQLVEKSGLARCTVSAVRGGKSCSPETARKLAEALGVDVTESLED